MSVEARPSAETNNPYFKLCHGAEVRMSDIDKLFPVARPAIEALMESRKIVGQFSFDEDLVLWMPAKTTFSGNLPPRLYQRGVAPRWEREWIEYEVNHLDRPKNGR